MKRKVKYLVSLFLVLVLSISYSAMVFAAEGGTEEQIIPYGNTTQSTTKSDRDGNDWKISRRSYGEARKATLSTTIKLQRVHDGTVETRDDILFNMGKRVSHSATVRMINGSQDTSQLTKSVSGWTSESYTIEKSYTYLYLLLSLTATHEFECNGLDYSVDSVWYR